MPNELVQIHPEYAKYPDVIRPTENNVVIACPTNTEPDIFFEQTLETLQDPIEFRNFIKNVESAVRSSREYKAYKSYLYEVLGSQRCQILGNVTADDADIELHHNVLGLFDICVLIAMHILNTVGKITTFDLIQLVLFEHFNNNVGVTFLSKTAHQVYTNDPNGFIPPDQTFGKWWELLYSYKYGITYEIAYKVINYIKKYQDGMPVSINLEQQEEILSWAWTNTYGVPAGQCGSLPDYQALSDNYAYGGLGTYEF